MTHQLNLYGGGGSINTLKYVSILVNSTCFFFFNFYYLISFPQSFALETLPPSVTSFLSILFLVGHASLEQF